MQHVNDDMDELFRRASENYPLKTDGADWNAVVKKMAPAGQEEPDTLKGNKNYRHLLWLLLLLPFGLLYKNYFADTRQNPVKTISKNVLSNEQNSSIATTGPNTVILETAAVTTSKSLESSTASRVPLKIKGKLNSSIIKGESLLFVPVKQSDGNSSQEAVSNIDIKSKGEEDKTDNEKLPLVITHKLEDTRDENTVDENSNNDQTKSTRKQSVNKPRGFYAGLVISPDLSNVKMQSVKNIGVSMGIIAGYQLNKKISIESGALWSKKNYSTEGKYFSTKKIYVPTGAKINSVNGACYMIEVPLHVKYNFGSAKQYISASAGISSYYIKKEKYVYEINRNGLVYPYSSTYKNTSSDILAVANLGFGYNRTLKKNISLRVEPYLKIPFKGMGIGSLPITSTGVNIGITKKISR